MSGGHHGVYMDFNLCSHLFLIRTPNDESLGDLKMRPMLSSHVNGLDLIGREIQTSFLWFDLRYKLHNKD